MEHQRRTMTVQEILASSRDLAERMSFPPFVGPERESTPLNASPYVAHLDDLREGAFLSARGALTREFCTALEQLPGFGVRAVAALLGGSAIGPKPDPGDLDCVVFYEALAGASPDATRLRDFLRRCKARRLDMRAVPIDGDPILMLKTVSFFSMLYSKNEGSLAIVRGLVLIDCRERASAPGGPIG
jgi:hypothetical protein